jgi:DNA segregation ATPase FtsK/SpoIIIE, S-DNA-T family
MLGVLGGLLLVGLLAWAGGNSGIVGLVGRTIAQLFGLAAWLVPASLIALAVLLVVGRKLDDVNVTAAIPVGLVALLLGLMGLLHLPTSGQVAAELGQGGGYVGLALATFLSDQLTGPGAAIVLVALTVVGVMLTFGLTLMQVARGVYRPVVGGVRAGRSAVQRLQLLRTQRELAQNGGASRERIRINGEDITLAETSSIPIVTFTDEAEASHHAPTQLALVLGDAPSAEPQTGSGKLYSGEPKSSAGEQEKKEKPKPVINMPEKRAGTSPQAMGPIMSPLGYMWNLPPLALLEQPSEIKVSQSDIKAKIKVLEEALLSFNVDAAVREVNTGPAVTQFALEPGVGVRVSRITSLEKDLALALAAPHIRLEAPIPGQSRVGIEVPNTTLQVVGLRGVMESDVFAGSKGRLKVPLGRDTHGRAVVTDLAKLPHLLVAGATGSGKSVFLNSLVITYLLQFTPDDLRMLMIDPKRVELTGFNGIPHLLRPVVTDVRLDKEQKGEGRGAAPTPNRDRPLTAVEALKWALWEMERRYKVFSKGVKDKDGISKVFRNIEGYRNFHKDNPQAGMEHLPYIVIIIDELADLMLTAPEEVETSLCRLAQLARATGIHLVVATQRPSVDVVTGLIKANFPARAAFAVTSQVDSKVILDGSGAEKLLGRGDMLYTASDESKPVRIQAVFVSDAESEAVVNFWRKQMPTPEEITDHGMQAPVQPMPMPDWLGNGDPDEASEMLEQAIELAKKSDYVSVSMLQRKLRIGYNRAARLVEQMEELGLIAPANPDNRGKPREVLLGAPDSRADEAARVPDDE